MSDNVIDIGTKQPVQNDQEKSLLERINDNKKKAFLNIEKCCDSFDERKMVHDHNPIDENSVRNVENAIKSTLTVLESIDRLVTMLCHDIVATITNLDEQGTSVWQTSAHLQVLLELMKAKNMVTENELRDTWNQIVPKMLEEMQKNQKK